MNDKWTRDKLLELGGGFRICRIFLSAVELDLFSKLRQTPRTVDALAVDEGWDPRGLRILMDALVSQGLLSKDSHGEYAVPEALAEWLTGDGEETILPMTLHQSHLWSSWSRLTEIVRTGMNPKIVPEKKRSREELESFIGAMHVVGRAMAAKIADSVDLSPFTRMLDVGGGSGTYLIAFLTKAPHLTGTLFDIPDVVELAKKRLTESGFIDRVELKVGDYNKDPLPRGHDLALLSAVIHINSREQNKVLYANVFNSLDPGGTILIRDHIMDATRTVPPDGAIFAVNMLTATSEGDTYPFDEIKEDLESVGFRDVRSIRDGGHMDQLVAAVR
ncbi:MAG: methyltransferase domain-containing protein [Desulfomonile tiedjei]|nr:methyltransferase domain-containing protein [Desulfomonile tiedjei]